MMLTRAREALIPGCERAPARLVVAVMVRFASLSGALRLGAASCAGFGVLLFNTQLR